MSGRDKRDFQKNPKKNSETKKRKNSLCRRIDISRWSLSVGNTIERFNLFIYLNIAIARAIVASPRTVSKKNLPHVWNVMWQKTQLKQFNQIEKVFRNRWKETNQTVNTFKPWLSLSLFYLILYLKIVYYVFSYRASIRCTSLSFVCVCVCTPVTFDFWPPGVKRQDRRRWVRLPLEKKKKRAFPCEKNLTWPRWGGQSLFKGGGKRKRRSTDQSQV